MLLRTITGLSLVLSAVLWFCLDAVLWLVPAIFAGCFLALLLLSFLVLWAFSAAVDLSVPQEHDSKFYRFLAMLYIESTILEIHHLSCC